MVASDQGSGLRCTAQSHHGLQQHYRGPEEFITLPKTQQERDDAIDEALAQHPDNGNILAAVVLEASPRKVVVTRADGDPIEITGEGLKPVQSGLSDKATLATGRLGCCGHPWKPAKNPLDGHGCPGWKALLCRWTQTPF